jgi:DNA-binding response OmpR family regulator
MAGGSVVRHAGCSRRQAAFGDAQVLLLDMKFDMKHETTDRGTAPDPIVLLVNDDVDVLEMYRVGLLLYGFHAVVAVASADAVEQRRHLTPDLIVADLSLSQRDGWRLLADLKGESVGRSAPIVLLTSTADAVMQSRAYELGCAAVLLKPCPPDELAVIARQLLDTSPAIHTRKYESQ